MINGAPVGASQGTSGLVVFIDSFFVYVGSSSSRNIFADAVRDAFDPRIKDQ